MRRATNGQITDAQLTSVSFFETTIVNCPSHPPCSAIRVAKSPSVQPSPETALSMHCAETCQQDDVDPHSSPSNFVLDFEVIYWSHAMYGVRRPAGSYE